MGSFSTTFCGCGLSSSFVPWWESGRAPTLVGLQELYLEQGIGVSSECR
jgi:hypothetical protein